MAEFGFGILPDVRFNLVPVALVVTDLPAMGADGNQPAQGFRLVNKTIFIIHRRRSQTENRRIFRASRRVLTPSVLKQSEFFLDKRRAFYECVFTN